MASIVEHNDYGWSVRVGAEQLGLFATQNHAVAKVQKRRATLQSKSQASTVSVIDPDCDASNYAPRPSWRR
jgi:hypothetical protein